VSTVTRKIKEELLALLPPTLYFFVALHLIALILGKSVLIADMLPFINRFPEKPLIWNVGWKTAIYFVVALVIHYLEHLYDSWKVAPGFAAANEKLLSQIVWPHFVAIQILLTVLILVYCVSSELARVLGPAKLKAMFFGPLPPAGRPS
jgi:hypothetical protein